MPSLTRITLPTAARWTPALQSLPALAIRQPYAWLVVNGIKDIENRSRRTHHRGKVLIHASLNEDLLFDDSLAALSIRAGIELPESYDIGGIVGVAEIVGCERRHESDWKNPSSWGWVLANARPLPFRPCKGALGFFRPKFAD
ncbi:MAG: ASCH domain-containing protein [Puniceicoccales bacterium]|jgi:hypothetical protein|nr:ASCH domain-containing protein [Puniceicoccales bacterium]